MTTIRSTAPPDKGGRQRCAPRTWEVRLPAGGAGAWAALADGEFRLALALESYARSRPVCWPSNAALAADCGCSEREVRRRLEGLEAAGWILRVRDRRERLQSRAGIALVRRLNPGLPVVRPGLDQAALLGLVEAARGEAEGLRAARSADAIAPTDRAGRATHGPGRPPESERPQRKKQGRRDSRQGPLATARTGPRPGDSPLVALARALGAVGKAPGWPPERPEAAAMAIPPTGGGERPVAGLSGAPTAIPRAPAPRRDRDGELARFRAWAAGRS